MLYVLCVSQDVSYWQVDESGQLKVAIDVSCWKKRYFVSGAQNYMYLPGGSSPV